MVFTDGGHTPERLPLIQCPTVCKGEKKSKAVPIATEAQRLTAYIFSSEQPTTKTSCLFSSGLNLTQ